MVTSAPAPCRARTVAAPSPEAPPATSPPDPASFTRRRLSASHGLRPETANVTRLTALSSQEPMAAGVTFNERMGGHVAACSGSPEEREDYRARYREGKSADGECHFEATMLIDDIAA